MATTVNNSKSYKLIDLYIQRSDDSKEDIRDLCAEFIWYESIDSPFVRLDITILDSVNYAESLLGDEMLHIGFNTFASKMGGKEPVDLHYDMQIYKISNVIKDERAKVCTINCISPQAYLNEANRAFGSFGPLTGKHNIVKVICDKYLKCSNKIKHVGALEDCTSMNMISPNWRPIDVISYISDKVVRKKQGKGSKVNKKKGKGNIQSGFMFYETRQGFNWRSIDDLCEQEPIGTFSYTQKNIGTPDAHTQWANIEQLGYPDRTNHLEKMRTGLYKTVTHGIVMDALTESASINPALSSSGVFDRFQELGNKFSATITGQFGSKSLSTDQFSQFLSDSKSAGTSTFYGPGGDSKFDWSKYAANLNFGTSQKQAALAEKKSKPAGTVQGPRIMHIGEITDLASTLEKGFAFDTKIIEKFEKDYPTRTKFRILPKYKNQSAKAPNGGADDAPDNMVLAGAYAAARFALLKTHVMNITIPGNTALYAGAVVKTRIPMSEQSRSGRVEMDKKFSGKYLVSGLKHIYKKDGVTTELFLCRDSLPVNT